MAEITVIETPEENEAPIETPVIVDVNTVVETPPEKTNDDAVTIEHRLTVLEETVRGIVETMEAVAAEETVTEIIEEIVEDAPSPDMPPVIVEGETEPENPADMVPISQRQHWLTRPLRGENGWLKR